jgi:hypothetical protein
MMRFLCLAAALLLAACATTPPPAASQSQAGAAADWLAGTWLMIGDGVEHPGGCNSGLPIGYSRDGRYTLFEESGTWRLQGERLTETATEVHDGADPAEVALGRPVVSRVQRTGPDSFRKTFTDGSKATFLRCPKAR